MSEKKMKKELAVKSVEKTMCVVSVSTCAQAVSSASNDIYGSRRCRCVVVCDVSLEGISGQDSFSLMMEMKRCLRVCKKNRCEDVVDILTVVQCVCDLVPQSRIGRVMSAAHVCCWQGNVLHP